MWLVKNHKWEPRGRFLIEVDDLALRRKLANQSGLSSKVCQWLVSFLLEPAKHAASEKALLVRVHKGRLLVNVKGMSGDGWKVYMSGDRDPPEAGQVSTALRTLYADEKEKKLNCGAKGKQEHYRIIAISHLTAWAESTGFASAEQIQEALEKDTLLSGSREWVDE